MKYAINAEGVEQPRGFYSQATTCGRFIFISGQIGVDAHAAHTQQDLKTEEARCDAAACEIDPTGAAPFDALARELDTIMQTCTQILAEVNCSLEDIAQLTIFVTSLDLVPLLDKLLPRYFGLPAPARQIAKVDQLPHGALIQISCIACR